MQQHFHQALRADITSSTNYDTKRRIISQFIESGEIKRL